MQRLLWNSLKEKQNVFFLASSDHAAAAAVMLMILPALMAWADRRRIRTYMIISREIVTVEEVMIVITRQAGKRLNEVRLS